MLGMAPDHAVSVIIAIVVDNEDLPVGATQTSRHRSCARVLSNKADRLKVQMIMVVFICYLDPGPKPELLCALACVPLETLA